MQPLCTSFPILNHSIVSWPVLTIASWVASRFLRRQVRCSGSPISLRIFHSLLWFTQSKALAQSIKQKKDIFLEFSCSFYDLDFGILISGFSAFSKSSLYIWNFSVHILLKPSLKDFKHYLASIWNKLNCSIVWSFFGIVFLWDWNEKWPFPLLSFPNLLTYWVQH